MNYGTIASRRAESDSLAGYINQVYAFMCCGLAITALVGYWTSLDPARIKAIFGGAGFWGIFILELILVIAIAGQTIPAAAATLLFMLFSALNGLTLSVVFIKYTIGSIGVTFGVTAGTFAVCSIYGFITKQDLTSLGNLLFMALIGLIFGTIANIFLASRFMDWVITWAGIIVFVGLTAYDTQKLRERHMEGCSAASGALDLYLDFVNLFLYLLKLFGKEKD